MLAMRVSGVMRPLREPALLWMDGPIFPDKDATHAGNVEIASIRSTDEDVILFGHTSLRSPTNT